MHESRVGQMSRGEGSWPRRHPFIALIGVNLMLFTACALLAEVFLRFWVPYNPGYYEAVRGNSREVEYPYGIIKINRDGFADEEFDLSRPLHVGYFGDSVTYGVGAGYGYRFTDLLRAAYPEFDHLNLGGIGLSVSQETIDRSVELAARYDLDRAVYFMNLNDIVPDSTVAPSRDGVATSVPWTRSVLVWLSGHADLLRGKSYLYTSLRTIAKNYLEAQGVGFHGYKAFEFQPAAERAVLVETAGRINLFHEQLAQHGVELLVVVVPYEMQISDEAARVYQSHGISWEDAFLAGSTQQILEAALSSDIRVVDLLPAFVDPEHPEQSRAENGVGEYFVYDRGDKLDWNHPNREGHRVIADYLTRIELLGPARKGVHAGAVARAAGH